MGTNGFIRTHSTAVAIFVYLAFLLVAGCVPPGMQDIAPMGFCAFFLGTGIVEEGVFCGMVFQLLRQGAKGTRMLDDRASGIDRHAILGLRLAMQAMRPAIVTAVLFGVAHLSFEFGIGLGLLKVLQAGLFGLCMVLLYSLTSNLSWPMMAHGFFDVAYFASAYMDTGALPPYPAAVSPDASLAVLAATALFFAIAAAIMFRLVNQKKEQE